jgi:hypothetical protein
MAEDKFKMRLRESPNIVIVCRSLEMPLHFLISRITVDRRLERVIRVMSCACGVVQAHFLTLFVSGLCQAYDVLVNCEMNKGQARKPAHGAV